MCHLLYHMYNTSISSVHMKGPGSAREESPESSLLYSLPPPPVTCDQADGEIATETAAVCEFRDITSVQRGIP